MAGTNHIHHTEPYTYRNWRAFDKGKQPTETREWQLFSDAHFTGEIKDLGPYGVLNAVGAPQPGRARSALVLREGQCADERGEPNTCDAYHGGHRPDEMAALLSLCTGARVKAGGWTRWFRDDGDPLGQPMGFGGEIDWQVSVRKLVLPRTVWTISNHVKLSEGDFADRIRTYPKLDVKVAAALIKSARLYQDALWLAEGEPHIAWLFFVSAIETAADQWRQAERTPVEHLEDVKPKLVKRLREHGGDVLVEGVANELASVTGATRNFREFILKFDTGPPTGKRLIPVDWANLRKAVNVVYDWRSKALHGGTPFPAPMCDPPIIQRKGNLSLDNVHTAKIAERPMGLAAGTGGAMWDNEETPMLLHVFEHITRGALLNWWASSDPLP